MNLNHPEPRVARPLYGRDMLSLLPKSLLNRPLVITQPEPWSVLRTRFGDRATVRMVTTMDHAKITALAAALPDGSAVFGIGGGMAADLAKFVSWKKSLPLVLMPSILSVDAAFCKAIAVREDNRVRYIGAVFPDYLLIDYDLLRTAPPDLNRAGVGDVISIFTALWDWREAAARLGEPYDAAIAAESSKLLDRLYAGAGALRDVTDDGLQLLSELYVGEVRLCEMMGSSRPEEGSEHFIAYCLEALTRRSFLHGRLVGLGVLVLLHFATSLLRNRLLLQLRTHLDAKLTLGFVDAMLRLPYSFFQRRHGADLIVRVGSVTVVREILTGAALSAAIDGVLVISSLVLLIVMSPLLAAVATGLVVLETTLFLTMRRKMRDLAQGGVAKQVEAANRLQELLFGIGSLKASGCEQRASQHWASSYVDLMNVNLKRGAYGSWTDAVFGTVRIAAPFVLLLVGIRQVMQGDYTLGTMLSAISFAQSFIGPMGNLIASFSSLQVVGIHLGRLDDVLATPPEEERPQRRILSTIDGGITVDDVSFRYSPNSPPVLHDISLDIRPGTTVALVGPSGCGKSTLASLLLGLYPPTSGRILYDGHQLADLDLRSVRKKLGVVVQQPHIFSTTVRANIGLADPATPLARIEDAAKRACIHDDIVRMPMGYDTPLLGGGGSISGGQRQRIALARALVNEPAILLLDEATSALDTVTETRVQAQLDSLACTRIVIAHRMSTVVGADMIVVLDKGRIVARGNHAELVAASPLYRELAGVREAPAEQIEAPDTMEVTLVDFAPWPVRRRA